MKFALDLYKILKSLKYTKEGDSQVVFLLGSPSFL